MLKFHGMPTAMNRHVTITGKSFSDLFDQLVDKGEMTFDTVVDYLKEKFDTEFLDDEGEWDEQAYYDAECTLTEEDFFEIMNRDNGNMYYQEYYRENDEGEWERI